jgi:hypothetical protein
MTRASANVSGEIAFRQPRPPGFQRAATAQKLAQRSARGARRLRLRREDLNRVMHKVINGGVAENFFATPRGNPARNTASGRAP